MIDFGIVKPGRTLYVPFSSFAGATGASITLTGLAVTDIEIYKDGGTTQRSSDNGYTLLDTDGIDFDGITGIHGFSISLADNSDAGFFAAGSRYFVVVSAVTIDSQTVSFVAATFAIGQPDAVLNTTIATLASQVSFTLTVGPAEDDALNDCWLMIHDVASAVQMAVGIVSDYTGATKTVTLAAAPTFTIAATDNIAVMGPMPLQATTAGRKLNADASGKAPATIAAGDIANNALTAAAAATDLVQEIRDAITGGAYAFSTDANGRVRIVDGTGAGELDSNLGHVILQDGSLITAKLGTFALAKTTNITGFNDLSAAQVNAEADTALTDYDPPTYTEILNVARLMVRKDAAIATDLSSVLTLLNQNMGSGGGTFANMMDANEAIRDRGDAAWITAAGFSTHSAADVWAVATRILTAGTNIALAKGTGVTGFTDLSAADVRTAVGLATANLDTQLDALPTALEVRNAVTGGAYALDTDANGRIRVVDGTGAGEINTASGAIVQVDQLGTQAKADVNAEVVDTLNVDTYAEPGQVTPPATTTIQNRIAHIYKRMRNQKTQSSTEFKLYGDDATTVHQKATISELAGVVTFGELVTGP